MSHPPISPAQILVAQRDLEIKIYNELRADFPKEAYQQDKSRGFALTSIRAQYIVERLNTVLGIGGWTLKGNFDKQDNDIVYFGTLVFRVGDKYYTHEGVGHSAIKKNLGDSYKSARTDCLSKIASLIGVGNEVFKGNVDPDTFETIDKEEVKKPATVGSFKNNNSTVKGTSRYG